MADRRMFHRQVVQSDDFLDMSIGAQALYFQMGMMADDDGFVAGPKQAARMVGVGSDELEELIQSGFLLRFDGIVALKHWRVANTLKLDRLKMCQFPDLAEKLFIRMDRQYTLQPEEGAVNLLGERKQALDSKGKPKVRKGKVSKEKIKEDNLIEGSVEESLPFPAAPGCPPPDERKPSPMFGLLGQGVVMLSQRERDSLLDLLGLEDFDKYVRKLSGFILANNAKIKDHYATILKWWEEDKII